MMLASFLTAIALSTAPQDYDTRHFDVMEIEGSAGCAIESHWTLEGRAPVYVQIDLMLDGEVYIAVSSYGWSRPSAGSRKLIGVSFERPGQENEVFALGGVPSGDLRPGLVALVGEDRREAFLTAFAGARSMNVYTFDMPEGDAPLDQSTRDLILQAGLQSSAQTLANARRCVANVTRREEARRAREAAVDHIAKDPFARSDEE